jgi:hypothetical protein
MLTTSHLLDHSKIKKKKRLWACGGTGLITCTHTGRTGAHTRTEAGVFAGTAGIDTGIGAGAHASTAGIDTGIGAGAHASTAGIDTGPACGTICWYTYIA